MDDGLEVSKLTAERPPLPKPTRSRWQPLRIGLVDLYHYDSEEFWFRDGHLLLRGNNGTGKSKVLSLTLPFLFDATLRPSRIEPDGDPGKKMAWNLLMNRYPRRNGYSWIEFGRLAEDGEPLYLTLGAGLSAVAARNEVDCWFFMLDDVPNGPRLGQDLWLVNNNRIVLTRERLREAIGGRGQVFETATTYRRAVDERLFHLGTKRYNALMDTLVQLRQPQLSRKPDETALSDALTEALPPLPLELLGDVAEALNQLDEDRRQLDEFKQLERAVTVFNDRYRRYAGTISRRQARELRQAQTEYDNASRERNEALARRDQARKEEESAEIAHGQAKLELAGARVRQDTLQSDPTMQDANRLESAKADVVARDKALRKAQDDQTLAQQRQRKEEEATEACTKHLAQTEKALTSARAKCVEHADAAGVPVGFAANALASHDLTSLAEMSIRGFDLARSELTSLVSGRREQMILVRQRRDNLDKAEIVLAQKLETLRERQETVAAALRRRAQADAAFDNEVLALVDAWAAHFSSLEQLRCEADAPLAALADWVVDFEGSNPAQQALRASQQDAERRLATRQHDLDSRIAVSLQEQADLEVERKSLEAGQDTVPSMPYTRAPDTRLGLPGAPFWQVVDFRNNVEASARAGLEAALEASGLLDAWVTQDGALVAADGRDQWLDSQMVTRQQAPGSSLAEWFCAAVPPDLQISSRIIDRLLAGVACADTDQTDAEAWISPDGRFRLGSLSGAWTKQQAVYIGFSARAAARERRLDEIACRLNKLADMQITLSIEQDDLSANGQQAEKEWLDAPSDEPLRQARVEAKEASVAFRQAENRKAEAEDIWRHAEREANMARETLEWDAKDLGLPTAADALKKVEESLITFNDAQHRMVQAVQEVQRAWQDHKRQKEREAETRKDVEDRAEQLGASQIEAKEAHARYDVLKGAVGAKVEALRQQLAEARSAVGKGEAALSITEKALRRDGEARAIADIKVETTEAALESCSQTRAHAITRLQRFSETSLLSAALPMIELPDVGSAWTIDPALSLARRTEQALAHLKDDDETWSRVQRQTTEDLQDLQRALGALGHQAPAETSDWGLVVHIIYQNQPQRPDQLATRLVDEIAQRSELLTAREREVLENHLQAEIAAEIQRLLQASEKQVLAINAELHKRPTTTGVRYRLQWQPLGESEGAPVGLEAARQKLLNTGADLWTTEDRRVVGTMLQSRIAAERERADASLGDNEGGGLVDLLARALDYRHWHRFRVQRLQDGQWRKLSGPASSGERALGLTVPLFAAVASYYSQGGYEYAPRLMLLDEAFAGIDDTARAHCMGLIREFDLDFVITSEREWACYAELPGVAICQLLRREGVDAVYVSRWTWDGRATRQGEDPDRRFPLP
ncbi:MAG: TIGR02680 family protein [Rhodospirillales bacterium]|nr:TIGR02680 family protein [Rhodospirillales bacterium]